MIFFDKGSKSVLFSFLGGGWGGWGVRVSEFLLTTWQRIQICFFFILCVCGGGVGGAGERVMGGR